MRISRPLLTLTAIATSRSAVSASSMASQKYIVVFKENATPEQINEYINGVSQNGGQVHNKYDSVLKGFAATIPDSYLNSLQSFTGDNGPINYIEPDGVVTTQS